MRPNQNEYGAFYHGYVQRVPAGTIVDNLKNSIVSTLETLGNIPEEKANYRYAAGKWTIKEVILHMIDVERIMSYRALRVSRGDTAPLPGFDENEYVAQSNTTNRTLADLIEEFRLVRQTTIFMFEHFTDKMLLKVGNASGFDVSTRALGYILVGHELHHMEVLKERYL